MGAMFGALQAEITRRRALQIGPLALTAAFTALSSGSLRGSQEESNDSVQEVSIVEFNDAGQKLRTVRVKKVIHSEAEWRKLLNIEQFYCLRMHNTELPFIGTYYRLHDPGIYRCIACSNAVFSSAAKYDTNTGWPTFTAPIVADNIHIFVDEGMIPKRLDVLCKRCDSHLGFLFEDGPPPSHKRYSLNEAALHFVAQAAK
jgi:peptide-methionine (R)-S-oxide reductase